MTDTAPVTRNNGTIDPTANVIALISSTTLQLKDLLNAQADLNKAEFRRLNDLLDIQVAHAKELALAESGRIDAIRAVDVNAVGVAAKKAEDQAAVLATQLSTTADNSRNALAIATSQTTDMVRQNLEPVMVRLTTLEQSRSASSGASDNTKTMVYGAILMIGLGLAFLTYNKTTPAPFVVPPGYTLVHEVPPALAH
jgi:hypothetical protein